MCEIYQAAIMRIGMREMKAFSKLLFPSVKHTTFFESCGVADLITTCCMQDSQQTQYLHDLFGGDNSIVLDGIQVYTKLRSSLLLPSSLVQCFAPNLYCCPCGKFLIFHQYQVDMNIVIYSDFSGGRNRECAGAFARNGGKSCILNE